MVRFIGFDCSSFVSRILQDIYSGLHILLMIKFASAKNYVEPFLTNEHSN